MPALLKLLLEMTATAACMIGVVFIVRSFLSRKMNPAVMVALWAIVLVRLCLPVTIASPVRLGTLFPQIPAAVHSANEAPVFTLPKLTDAAAIPTGAAVDTKTNTNTITNPNELEPDDRQPVAGQANAVKQSGFFSAISIWDILLCIWLLGVFVVLLAACRRALLFSRKLRFCRAVEDPAVLLAIQKHRGSLGIQRTVAALECNFVQVPSVFGFIRPRVLLPVQFLQQMDPHKLDGILLHELCHIKRGDIPVNYLWLLAKAVHWFNPLVWLAYRLFQCDNELMLDQMVVRRMGRADRLEYSQSLIDSVRLARGAQAVLPAALTSLFKNKSKISERVTRMVSPQKKSKLSLAVTSLLALLMLVSCFTTACQPVLADAKVLSQAPASTPTAPADKAAQPAPSAAAPAQNEFAGYAKTWNDTVTMKQHPITIRIKASVITPDTDKLPVYEVLPQKLTQDQVDGFLSQFGAVQYHLDMELMTKADYQKEIVQLQANLAKLPDDKEYNGTQKKILKKEYEDAIAADKKLLEENLAVTGSVIKPVFTNQYIIQRDTHEDIYVPEPNEAPDNTVHKTVKEVYESTNTEAIQVKWHVSGDGAAQYLSAGRSDSMSFNFFQFTKGAPYGRNVVQNNSDLIGVRTTYAKALALAQDAVMKLKLDYMALADSAKIVDYSNLSHQLSHKDETGFTDFSKLDSVDEAYVFYFSRKIGSVNETYCSNLKSANQYNDPWQNVHLYVVVDDSGVKQIQWGSTGSKLGNKFSDDSKLLPFEQIQTIAREQFAKGNISFDYAFSPTAKAYKYLQKMNLDIDRVTLGYAMVKQSAGSDGYKLVPVWDFFGSYAYSSTIDPANPGNTYSKQFESTDDYDHSYLTINAVDGTIIDRSKGN